MIKALRRPLLLALALLGAVGSFMMGSASAEPRTVLIGLAAPMSGLSGSTGVALERAAQLAVDDLNSGKPVIAGEPVLFLNARQEVSPARQADPAR